MNTQKNTLMMAKVSEGLYNFLDAFTYCLLLWAQLVVIGIIESGVVHHGGNHQVDVDPKGVVEHKPDEGQESEDISDGNPLHTCWSFHDGAENF